MLLEGSFVARRWFPTVLLQDLRELWASFPVDLGIGSSGMVGALAVKARILGESGSSGSRRRW